MDEVSYPVLTGRVVVVGKAPDGDSVRFVADDPARFAELQHGDRVRVSADGSVQLRLDGVDAPELHYAGTGQPGAAAARDSLLRRLGVSAVELGLDGQTVIGATPPTVRAAVLTRMVEENGRPVAIVFAPDPSFALTGVRADLGAVLLERSINVRLAAAGLVYPLLYSSTAPALRAVFAAAGRRARAAGAGAWAADATAAFSVRDARAVGPDGDPIWPKLFRRVVDHLRERLPGQTLPAWLATTPDRDDQIHVLPADGDDSVPLHTLLVQDGDVVRLVPDLLDLVVVEREAPAAHGIDGIRR